MPFMAIFRSAVMNMLLTSFRRHVHHRGAFSICPLLFTLQAAHGSKTPVTVHSNRMHTKCV